jgi:hypothetical protein
MPLALDFTTYWYYSILVLFSTHNDMRRIKLLVLCVRNEQEIFMCEISYNK